MPFEYEEGVTLTVKAVSGSRATISPESLSKDETCTVTYTPNPGVFEDKLVITAVDAAGLTTSAGVRVVVQASRPPVVALSPTELDTRPGGSVLAAVTATDPDGDWITLTKTSGPGAFARVEGKGQASGTWSWTVPKKLFLSPTWVRFVANDPCGGVDYGFLHIRTVTLGDACGART